MLNPDRSAADETRAAWGDHATGLSPADEARLASINCGSDEARAGSGVGHVAILFATETGSSEDVARALLREAEALALTASLQDVGDVDLGSLAELDVLLFVTSTTGEGEVPYTAEEFFERIEGDDAPDLSGLRFAVLALGDSTYELFCEAGKRLDRALAAAGAERILDRVDCDVDYEESAAQWRKNALAKIVGANVSEQLSAVSSPVANETSIRHAPVVATVVENRVLTEAGSSKATRHIALEFCGEPPAYTPGDALGLIVENDDAVVAALIDALSFNPDGDVSSGEAAIPLHRALRELYEISTLTPRFIEAWAGCSQSPALLALQDDGPARMAFMRANHVIDVVRNHPVRGLGADAFVAMLRPMQPRLYSIASSQRVAPREVHLTVAPVAYDLNGETRRGVATGQLALRAPVGSQVQGYVQPNEHFRLPPATVPVIMIGPGTGIAPFRAFLQERSCEKDKGQSWLFFGERNEAVDFLYRAELERHLAEGTLTRIDTAFSRDGNEKVYVQHRLAERADEVTAWIDAGAHVYICGDAGMANDVHEALIAAIAGSKRIERAAAEDMLNGMRREKRYQRDVY